MCYWNRKEPKAEHEVPKEKPLVAFKKMAYSPGSLSLWDGWDDGGFKSPRGTIWRGLKHHVRGTLHRDRWSSDNGVYCFKTKHAAKNYNNSGLTVKLRVWGQVFEYGGSRGRYSQSKYAGYRVQHAEIVEVFLPARWNPRKRKSFVKHLAVRYPNLKVTEEKS